MQGYPALPQAVDFVPPVFARPSAWRSGSVLAGTGDSTTAYHVSGGQDSSSNAITLGLINWRC